MPAEHSYEWNLQELVRLKLLQNAFFATKEFRHWDARTPVVLDAIVIRARKDEVNLDGVQGFTMTADCIFQTTTLSEADSDALALNVSQEMYREDPFFLPDLPDIVFISLEPDTKTDRNNTAKLRRWTVSFPFIIKLLEGEPAPPIDDMLYLRPVDEVSNYRVSAPVDVLMQAPSKAGLAAAVGYFHTQSVASSLWTISHNLGYKPVVRILNTGGQEVEADIIHTSDNVLTINFVVSIAGTAHLI